MMSIILRYIYNFFKIQKHNNYMEYLSAIKSYGYFKWMYIISRYIFILIVIWIISRIAFYFIKGSNNNSFDHIVYTQVFPMYIIPIYIYVVFSLTFSMAILVLLRKIIPLENKWVSVTFSMVWSYIGGFTSIGFIFGVFVTMYSFLDNDISSKLDIFTVVGGASLAGTFIGLPVVLLLGLVRVSRYFYKLRHGALIVPAIFILSWHIPIIFNHDLLGELYLKSANVYGPKIGEFAVELYLMQNKNNVDVEEKKKLVEEATQIIKNSLSTVDQGAIFWSTFAVLVFFMAIFIMQECIIRKNDVKNLESYVEYKF